MNKKEIDRQVKRYQKGLLNRTETKRLAMSIIDNKKAKERAISGAISIGRLDIAFSLLAWESHGKIKW